MNQATVTSASSTKHGYFADAQCGKVSATVAVLRNEVWVASNNAAHRAWRGIGRRFQSVDAAIAGYKTEAMKQIIAAVAAAAGVEAARSEPQRVPQ